MNNKTLIFGAILICLGFFFLARTLGIFWFSFGELISFIFPAILIILGIRMIMKKKREENNTGGISATINVHHSSSDSSEGSKSDDYNFSSFSSQASATPSHEGNNKLKYSKMLGDVFIDFNGLSLQNIVVTTFIGDIELKLHDGILSKGLNRLIISGFIGDVRILIPKGIAVYSQCSNFIGDIDLMGRHASGFGNNVDAQTPDYQTAESKLYIASNHFIGDIRVYIV